MRAPRLFLSLVTSAALHAALVLTAPFQWPERPAFVPPPVVEEAELGPVNVGIYEEPAPEPAPPPPPAPPPIAKEKPVADAAAPAPAAVAKPDPQAEPAKPTREQRREEIERRRTARRVVRQDKRPPCPAPTDDIALVAEGTWSIQRDLVEYYASHLKELMKLGSVSAHATDGKPDGFRVALARCSILREGGLRSGDVVHDIDGHKVNNVLQAVAAYFALRKQDTLTVHVTRQGKAVAMTYHIEGKPGRAARIKLKDLR